MKKMMAVMLCGLMLIVSSNIAIALSESDLITAASEGNLQTIQDCAKQGINVNIKDKRGRTPLMLAIQKNAIESVKFLLEQGADVNAKTSRNVTPLMFAALNNANQVASMLLEHGVNVSDKDNDGMTALIYAVEKNNAEMSKLLLTHGADANSIYKNGIPILSPAIEKGYINVIAVFLEHGIDINAIIYPCEMQTFLGTALMKAIIDNGNAELIKLFIEHNADINIKEELYGLNALSLAIRRITWKRDDFEALKLLLNNGADVNAWIKKDPSITPLMGIAGCGNNIRECSGKDIAQLLIEYGADVNMENIQGMTALSVAAMLNDFELVKLLVKSGANLDTQLEKAFLWVSEMSKDSNDKIKQEYQEIITYLNQAKQEQSELKQIQIASPQKEMDEQLAVIKTIRSANELYVMGYKFEKTNPQMSIAAYQEILDRFPDADAAVKAIDRLDMLQSGSTTGGAAAAKAEIQGIVQDVLGNPLSGVSARVLKTTLEAATDQKGAYALGYVPGTFTIEFSKSGYQTHTLELTIQTAAVYPSEPTTLIPAPNLYYIDEKRNQFFPLPQCAFTRNNRKLVEEGDASVILKKATDFPIPQGQIRFLNTLNESESGLGTGKGFIEDNASGGLFKVDANGRIFHKQGFKILQNGIIDAWEKRTPFEIKTYTLDAGQYAWGWFFNVDNVFIPLERDQRCWSFEVIGDNSTKKIEEVDDSAKLENTKQLLRAIGTALGSYQVDYDVYPSAIDPKNLTEFYYNGTRTDGWETPLEYVSDTNEYAIISKGSDKTSGDGKAEFEQDIFFVNGTFAKKEDAMTVIERIRTSIQKPNPTATPAKVQEEKQTTLFGIVTTQQDALNIREGAGKTFNVIAKANKGEKLLIIETTGEWYKVQLPDGAIGYALSEYVKIQE